MSLAPFLHLEWVKQFLLDVWNSKSPAIHQIRAGNPTALEFLQSVRDHLDSDLLSAFSSPVLYGIALVAIDPRFKYPNCTFASIETYLSTFVPDMNAPDDELTDPDYLARCIISFYLRFRITPKQICQDVTANDDNAYETAFVQWANTLIKPFVSNPDFMVAFGKAQTVALLIARVHPELIELKNIEFGRDVSGSHLIRNWSECTRGLNALRLRIPTFPAVPDHLCFLCFAAELFLAISPIIQAPETPVPTSPTQVETRTADSRSDQVNALAAPVPLRGDPRRRRGDDDSLSGSRESPNPIGKSDQPSSSKVKWRRDPIKGSGQAQLVDRVERLPVNSEGPECSATQREPEPDPHPSPHPKLVVNSEHSSEHPRQTPLFDPGKTDPPTDLKRKSEAATAGSPKRKVVISPVGELEVGFRGSLAHPAKSASRRSVKSISLHRGMESRGDGPAAPPRAFSTPKPTILAGDESERERKRATVCPKRDASSDSSDKDDPMGMLSRRISDRASVHPVKSISRERIQKRRGEKPPSDPPSSTVTQGDRRSPERLPLTPTADTGGLADRCPLMVGAGESSKTGTTQKPPEGRRPPSDRIADSIPSQARSPGEVSAEGQCKGLAQQSPSDLMTGLLNAGVSTGLSLAAERSVDPGSPEALDGRAEVAAKAAVRRRTVTFPDLVYEHRPRPPSMKRPKSSIETDSQSPALPFPMASDETHRFDPPRSDLSTRLFEQTFDFEDADLSTDLSLADEGSGIADSVVGLDASLEQSSVVAEGERLYRQGRQLIFGAENPEKNYVLGLSYLREAACLGHSKAALDYALLSEEGKICERNLEEAAVFFGVSANAGDALGEAKYGFCLCHGRGIRRNESEGARFCKLAADGGSPLGECLYGCCLRSGMGIARDIDGSLQYFQLSAGHGHAGGQYYYGLCLENGWGIEQNEREAAKYYEASAAQGHAGGQLYFGRCLETGCGIDQNEREAARYYKLSADQGRASGQSCYGRCLEKGRGIDRNVREAIRYYRLAADQGRAYAQDRYGLCLLQGRGIERNAEEAVRYFKLSADQGDARGQLKYGICLEQGEGIGQNVEEAAKYYKLSADQGDAGGQWCYALCLDKGRGIAENAEEAVRYLKLSADQGDVLAQLSYGHRLRKGRGTRRDLTASAHYLKLAADQGHAVGQRCYAYCLENGQGIAQDITAGQGQPCRQVQYGICLENGKGNVRNLDEAVQYYKLAADRGCARRQIGSLLVSHPLNP
jgi:TPR repeat protein